MNDVYLLLGSNEGNRIDNLHQARKRIEQGDAKIINQSAIYETEAWGLKEQTAFLNQALRIETPLPAVDLLVVLKSIEEKGGRVESQKWGPRLIDIDILFYGNDQVDLPELKIPHPYLPKRKFTLVPLEEIAKDFIHPALKKSIATLLTECSDKSEVKKLTEDDRKAYS